jgi:hypothetical protein
MRLIFLDAGPLGELSNPEGGQESARIWAWSMSLLGAGAGVVVPEIADYEVRRELIRIRSHEGVRRLDGLAAQALKATGQGDRVVVATDNARHLT